VNPFGLFVELDPESHGLCHISELSHQPVKDPLDIVKPGESIKFRIISLDPQEHRLGLSIKAIDKPKEETKEEVKETAKQTTEDTKEKTETTEPTAPDSVASAEEKVESTETK
ncbi:MAG: S1 RNA-binding domain-containing protein, partial [Candidatus Kerfeldbacteria bacterium]|nr:S1 RNA-binding domain-containing protein [Candidatus Kerfeldbacteria bacterium]